MTYETAFFMVSCKPPLCKAFYKPFGV